MGWSEQYWEDVKSELAQLAADQNPAGEDEALDLPPGDPPASGPPASGPAAE